MNAPKLEGVDYGCEFAAEYADYVPTSFSFVGHHAIPCAHHAAGENEVPA